MIITDLLLVALGEILGSATGSATNKLEDYTEYRKSGQYDEDYGTGSDRANGMSDRALYKEMSNRNRSVGERLAYKDELKKRGY